MNRKIQRETLLYIAGSLVILIIGFAIKSLQTKGLSPEDFGNYTFISSYTAFTVLFFQFGYIPTLKLVLARQEQKNYSKVIGAGFVITLILGLLFSGFIFISSFFVDQVFDTRVSEIMLIVSPLFFSFLFVHFFNSVGTGIGRPSIGIFFELSSRILYAAVLYFLFVNGSLSVKHVLFFSALSHFTTILLFYFILKPSFLELKPFFDEIKATHKNFGKDYFIGSVANQTSFKIDDLIITAWISPLQLGFYALARILTSPIGLAASALNNALFKNYSKEERIPKNVFIINTAIAALGVIVINGIGSLIIVFVFGQAYEQSADYIFLFSLAFFFMALYQPFNFLTAKGKGKVVRNTSFAESAVNILGNFILIPTIGILGALITTLSARILHFVMKWYYYNKYLKELNG